MTKYIIAVTDNTDPTDLFGPTTFDIPCETLHDLETELRSFTRWVEYGVKLDVFKFDDETLDYDLVDHIEA